MLYKITHHLVDSDIDDLLPPRPLITQHVVIQKYYNYRQELRINACTLIHFPKQRKAMKLLTARRCCDLI